MARLKTTVFVVDPDGRDRSFGPGDGDLPDWAVQQIRNPNVWDGPVPDRPSAPAQPPAGAAPPLPPAQATEEQANGSGQGGDPDPVPEPPRSGKGSGRAAWEEYARLRGVDAAELGDDPAREDIINLLIRRGLIKD